MSSPHLSSFSYADPRDGHVKVWGLEIWICNDPEQNYCGKLIELVRGAQCSLHFHRNKHETFYVLSGIVRFELGDVVRILRAGDIVVVPREVKHRFGGLMDSTIIEISDHHDENDSYRDPGELSRFNPDLLGIPE